MSAVRNEMEDRFGVEITQGAPDRKVEAAPAMRALAAQNLGKQFKKRPVLRNVSVSVERGEAVGLLGPNGAGKTNCFYIITGLIRTDYGTISLDGTDITDMPM